MAESPIGSPMLQGRAPLVLDLPDEAWFDVELMHKDIRLALATARPARRAPLRRPRRPGLTAATDGYGHRDIAALYEVLANTPPR